MLNYFKTVSKLGTIPGEPSTKLECQFSSRGQAALVLLMCMSWTDVGTWEPCFCYASNAQMFAYRIVNGCSHWISFRQHH